MAARKKSGSRKSAARKAAKARKPRVAAKKKAAKAPKRRTTAKKKVVRAARKPVPAATKAVVPAAAAPAPASPPPPVTELDNRIAIVRANLRDLVDQAASSAGAANEELLSQRITEQEERLRRLIEERDQLSQ